MKIAIIIFASINVLLMLFLMKTAARSTTSAPMKALGALALLTVGGLGLFFANLNSALNWIGLLLVGGPAVFAAGAMLILGTIVFIAWITGARWN